jgi:hypothetical protein
VHHTRCRTTHALYSTPTQAHCCAGRVTHSEKVWVEHGPDHNLLDEVLHSLKPSNVLPLHTTRCINHLQDSVHSDKTGSGRAHTQHMSDTAHTHLGTEHARTTTPHPTTRLKVLKDEQGTCVKSRFCARLHSTAAAGPWQGSQRGAYRSALTPAHAYLVADCLDESWVMLGELRGQLSILTHCRNSRHTSTASGPVASFQLASGTQSHASLRIVLAGTCTALMAEGVHG